MWESSSLFQEERRFEYTQSVSARYRIGYDLAGLISSKDELTVLIGKD